MMIVKIKIFGILDKPFHIRELFNTYSFSIGHGISM